MKTLDLIITRQWLWEILFNGKGEEYRDVSPHYKARICACYGTYGCIGCRADCSNCAMAFIDRAAGAKQLPLHDFDAVRLRAGYHPKAAIALIECGNIEIGIGNPDWGAPVDKEKYKIELGKVLETHNCESLRFEFLNPNDETSKTE